ncbi:MAG: class III extradiol ring-cleavage dioxygenase [Cyanobacteria bacterium J06634_5]
MVTTTSIPSLFISHGAPDLPLSDCLARAFLSKLGQQLPRPKAILVISPHWMTSVPTLSTALKMSAIHDFGGFSATLSQLRYDATGLSADLHQAILNCFKDAQLPIAVDPSRGLDHGAWVPLLLMYPNAQIPVTQLSLPAHWQPSQLLKLGRVLAPLRNEHILILSSGSATHNLWAFGGHALDAAAPEWVEAFEQWLISAIERSDTSQLLNYKQAPYAQENHPTPEHLLPLFIAMGAGNEGAGKLLHRSYTYGVFSMASFSFGGKG